MENLSRDFRCIAVDLPGHGHSLLAATGMSPLLEFIAQLRELFSRLHVSRCGLIGYSMGGRLALHFALAHPEVVEFLVLESASPGIDEVHERVARREADEKWAAMLERDGVAKFLDVWYAQPLFASLRARPELLAEISARRIRESGAGILPAARGQDARVTFWAAALRDFSPGFVPSLWPRLAEWRAPLLFIAGELDAKYCEVGKRVAGLCPRGTVHIVRDSGHVVHEEQPGDFLAALRNFPMIGISR
jgi:2-succinyl-6-hydroxy-2,4-cyclohexadiene-1-carboxylate synthase